MGISLRKRVSLTRKTSLNLSNKGVSVSHKAGPVTINSKGRASVRLGKGVSWKI